MSQFGMSVARCAEEDELGRHSTLEDVAFHSI